MFHKILIANRGEIALRIHRACKDLNIQTVAVHSTADADAMHVRLADEAVCIGPAAAKDSYLNMAAILSAAHITGADAIHPGIGFLSENANFAQMVEEHSRVFIGPSAEHINIMGNKVLAKEKAKELGIPVVPGSDGAISSSEEAIEVADGIGYPVIIKAAAGGGGRGMKIAYSRDDMSEALSLCKSEAKAAFGSDEVYIEKYLEKPRHIEVQVLGDGQGGCVHLGERDCSIQRRHQKVIEEAHSPVITEELRAKIGKIVADATRGLGYRSVGTIEFLYENGEFYFIEMNTRLQVEHSVTELVYNVDLVREQISVAAGNALSLKQEDLKPHGHAIECRINAEHPRTFMPSPGKVTGYHAPGGLGVRVDSHVYPGYSIPPYYDSLISKLIVFAETRKDCIARLHRALDEYVVEGISTNIPLHKDIIQQNQFITGDYDIHWLSKWMGDAG